jgi:hypothetical protein
LYKKIKPKVLKDIEDLVREVVANNVNSVVYVDHIRDITKMFEVKMIDKMRSYKFVLGIFWGSIIFFYEKIINGNLIIDEYSFLLFIVIAIITWMIIESYTEANKLVFLYLDMAVLNCRGKTSLNNGFSQGCGEKNHDAKSGS